MFNSETIPPPSPPSSLQKLKKKKLFIILGILCNVDVERVVVIEYFLANRNSKKI